MPSCRSMVATLILEMRLPRFRCCAAGYIPGGGSRSTRASSTSTRVGPGPASRPRRVPAGPAAGQGAARRRRRHRPQMAHTPVAVAANRRVWSEVHAVEVALVGCRGQPCSPRECPASSPSRAGSGTSDSRVAAPRAATKPPSPDRAGTELTAQVLTVVHAMTAERHSGSAASGTSCCPRYQ